MEAQLLGRSEPSRMRETTTSIYSGRRPRVRTSSRSTTHHLRGRGPINHLLRRRHTTQAHRRVEGMLATIDSPPPATTIEARRHHRHPPMPLCWCPLVSEPLLSLMWCQIRTQDGFARCDDFIVLGK